ncbi:hypothetical protein CEK28_01495 [Xenophilus sp. AP218F]|nr:hypothetical protein CEK28_01495 [Xenophilus sp. AP218F]
MPAATPAATCWPSNWRRCGPWRIATRTTHDPTRSAVIRRRGQHRPASGPPRPRARPERGLHDKGGTGRQRRRQPWRDGGAGRCLACRRLPARAVISLLGGKDANGRRVDAAGNINAINAAAEWRHGLPFLLLTSLGCDEQFADMPPAVQQALGEALRAKTLAERCLRASPLAWAIARPGGLSHQDGIGRYRLAASPLPGRAPYLSRSDVALAALDLLADATRQKQAWTILAADPEP